MKEVLMLKKDDKNVSLATSIKNQTPTEEKFDFDDILIEPAKTTSIHTRKDVDIYYDSEDFGILSKLPLIAAPMDTVVSSENYFDFIELGINVCLPRGEHLYFGENLSSKSQTKINRVTLGNRMVFESFSLIDFTKNFIANKAKHYPKYVLIDIANGHMSDLAYVTKKAKEFYGSTMTLMVGNVANPETYKLLSKAGADYIRIGIGNGGGCLTTEQTGIGYPMGSLIKECYNTSKKIPKKSRAKIVADGGMKKYADIIKALALGADYVMVGSIFNKSLNSCGQNYWNKVPVGKRFAKLLYERGFSIKKKFRGMSTKEVQRKWGKQNLKTSEGVVRVRKVEYTLSTWVNNFSHYLKSAMSYANSKNLNEFIGKPKTNKITSNSFKRYNK
jgi:IMP dehydrogenase/GMP reductase